MDVNSHRQRMEDIQKGKRSAEKTDIQKQVYCTGVLSACAFSCRVRNKQMYFKYDKTASGEKAAQVTPTRRPRSRLYQRILRELRRHFFEDSAFVGNSFIDGMIIYDLVDGADYFFKGGSER